MSVGTLRMGVAAFAAQHDADAAEQADIALAVSEALSNAVIHGFVDESPGDLHVVAERHAGQLVVRVIDNGCGMTPRPDSPGVGLGAPLMAALTADLRIGPGPDGTGTETRLTFELQAATRAASTRPRPAAAAPEDDPKQRGHA